MRESFAKWRIPRDMDGVLVVEDFAAAGGQRLGIGERHFHAELELHFVERGQGLVLLADQRLPVVEGTLLWIPPGREHLLLEFSRDFKRWVLLARKRLLHRTLPRAAYASLLGKPAREQVRRLSARSALSLRRTLEDLSPDARRPRPIWNASVGFGLARCWSHFSEAAAEDAPSTPFHPAVSRALGLLRHDAVALPDLAARAWVSESHLSKLFMAQVGVSITEFRNRLCLERFVALYGDGRDAKLMSAALDAGFGSYAHFHRVFRAHFGYSPAKHRART